MDFFVSDPFVWLLLLIPLAAMLYSSVGYGGASGYLAVMALLGMPPEDMKPAALLMNIVVAGVVFIRLYRAGHFKWHLFAPFAFTSAPTSLVGGAYTIEAPLYKCLVGIALVVAALRLFIEVGDQPATHTPKLWIALIVGAAIGFVSGLTGVGGGIFLSPILLFFRWADMRSNAAVASAFILLNSITAIMGYASVSTHWPAGLSAMVLVAFVGGLIGSEMATRRVAPAKLRKLLGVILLIAGLKFCIAG